MHIEVKGTKSGVLPRSTLLKWAKQLDTDCPSDQLPVLFHQSNGNNLVGLVLLKHFYELEYGLEVEHYELVLDESFKPAEVFERLERKFRLTDIMKRVEYVPRRVAAAYMVSPDCVFIAVTPEYLIEAMRIYEDSLRTGSY